jgi:hypothetical protein
VDVSSLASGAYNVPYYVQLAGTGGTGPSFYTWKISSGSLPNGFTLAGNGELSGIPLADGNFTFTVRVEDNEGNWGEKALSLLVTRKRWVAYRSNQVVDTQYVVYLRDFTKTSLPVTDLSSYASANCSEDLGEFSPDGKKFAFFAGRGTSCDQKWLYVVDVSTATVGNAFRVDKNTGVYSFFGWSPDSKWLAYSELTNATSKLGTKYLVDVSGSLPGTPVAFETDGSLYNSHRFISPTKFVWLDANYAITYTELSSSGTWEPKTKTTGTCGGGNIGDSRPSGLIMCNIPYNVGGMELYDISSGKMSAVFYGKFSYDYTLIVDYLNPTTAYHDEKGILKLVATNKPLFSTIDLGVRPNAVWANTSNNVYALATSTVNAFHVSVGDGGGSAASGEIPSTVGYVNMKISPNDKWIAWGSTTAVALSLASGANRTIVSKALPASGTMSNNLQFAPNSTVFSFAGQMETAGINELYLVNLATGTVETTRKANGALATGTTVNTTGFTSDSSAVYYQVGTAATSALYLSSAIAQEPQGIQLATKFSAFRFQP